MAMGVRKEKGGVREGVGGRKKEKSRQHRGVIANPLLSFLFYRLIVYCSLRRRTLGLNEGGKKKRLQERKGEEGNL